jgi:hypothetical protein
MWKPQLLCWQAKNEMLRHEALDVPPHDLKYFLFYMSGA